MNELRGTADIRLGLRIVVYKVLEKVTKCGSMTGLKLTNGDPLRRSAPIRILSCPLYNLNLHQVFKPYTKGAIHERNIDMLWAAQTLGLGLWLGLGFNMHEHEHVPLQASVDRDCPTCLQRHLSNIL